jgi:uncharacterized protein YecT (DUF1311 family)
MILDERGCSSLAGEACSEGAATPGARDDRLWSDTMVRTMPPALGLALVLAVFSLQGAHAQQDQTSSCTDPNSQAEIYLCAKADADAAEREMETTYASASAALREQDQSSADLGPQYVGAESRLARSQAAWAANRADFCAAHGIRVFGGSMQRTVMSSCLALLARSRTEELRSFLE